MILDRILKRKAEETAELLAPRRRMSAALRREGLSVIGEIKRASPSRGVINEMVDPREQLLGRANAADPFDSDPAESVAD